MNSLFVRIIGADWILKGTMYLHQGRQKLIDGTNRADVDHKLLPRSPTMAFSSVRENVNPNTQLEMCWKMLLFRNYFI